MAEIFISYKSERRAAAEHFAEVLKRYGYSVWFDYELVKGKDFAEQIERKVREAKALVALWCSLSVSSRWVREEVHLAHDLGSLVPVKIEACEIPFGFRLPDTIDLTEWDGAPRSHQLDPLIDALESRIGRAAAQDRKALIEYEATWRRFGALSLKAFALNAPLEAAEAPRFHAGEDHGAPKGQPTGQTNGGDNGLLGWSEKEWERLKDSTDIERLQAFASHAHPYYAALARKRIVQALEAETRRGRIEIDAAIARNDRGRWFLPGAGKTEWFKDLDIGPEMVVIPAGSFMMGSPEKEVGQWSDEGPQHKVTIAKPFAVGRYALTFAEWDAAQKDKDWRAITGLAARQPNDYGWGRGQQPVIDVSWNDAKAFAKWLSAKMGKDYRLLSEAEWEYVCRAGTATPFWWGSSISTAQANYDGNHTYAGGKKGEYLQKTVPVNSFQPNPWGLYQVHGNVWEWCEDCWNENYKGAPDDGSAWTSGDCSRRVLRGGSWYLDPWNLRAADRDRFSADYQGYLIGFRLARTLNP